MMNNKFYTLERCNKIFNAIENPNWRIWKVLDENQLMHQSRRPICNPRELLNFIGQFKNPQALYTGISTFFSPQSNHGFFINQKITFKDGTYLYPKHGWIIADCILLDSYFFVDLDDENDISLAQEDGRKIIKHMEKNPDFKLKEIRFSGTKGIHLEYKRIHKPEIFNPIDRIKAYKAQNEKIANELIGLGLKTMDKHHISIMKDLFRVCAAPHSIKAKSGGIVQSINLNEFMTKSIFDILSLKPTRANRKAASDGLFSPDDEQRSTQGRNALQHSNILGKGRAGLSTYPNYFGIIANFVPGLRSNYVPFIKMHKSRRVDLNDIKEDLGDLLIFGEKNHYWLIGYKLFQKDKLLKVMRRLKASNCMEFQRRYAKFRFTNILDRDRQEIEPAPTLLHKIKSKKKYTYSLSHKNFFKEFDCQDKMYGKPELKTYEAISSP